MSKKLQQKQERRRAEELRKSAQHKATRRTNMLTIGAAVVIATVVVVAIVVQKSNDGGVIKRNVGVAATEAGCTGVEEFEEQGASHIEVGSEHEPYNSTPPTSGPHYATPADFGFFSDPVPPEQLVHNMEHGQIVIWFNPAAPQELKDEIADLVDQQPSATVAAPFPGLESPHQLALTAWGRLQSCEQVSQEVVDEFRSAYQGRGPENVGVPTFNG